MCATCGCAGDDLAGHVHEDGTWHEDGGHGAHPHDEPHHDGQRHDGQQHDGQHAHGRTVTLAEKVLARNDALAGQNRDWLRERGILAVNLMSSPGAGKTTLLERTAAGLAGELVVGVIEGDQETALDADRMRAAGCQVVQVNTGTGCHLDAVMVRDALTKLDPPGGSVVVIENVGNLVCPALFDLGEAHRVVLASVTEGTDKPVKYPHMFRSADLVLVTKTDLMPYLDFDLARCTADLGKISPGATVLPVSARAGDGIGGWYDWLRRRALLARGSTPLSRGQAPGPHGPEPPAGLRPAPGPSSPEGGP